MALPEFGEYQKIVADLAAEIPYEFNEGVWQCARCQQWAIGVHNLKQSLSSSDVLPVVHASTCLWRRARELVGGSRVDS